MAKSTRSLTGIVSTALVFGAGVVLASPVRNLVADLRERGLEPAARAAYELARSCRYDALSDSTKVMLAVRALDEQPAILGEYANRIGSRAWNELLYTTTLLAKEEKD
jgi:hypothetical protein